jgi:aminoacylase
MMKFVVSQEFKKLNIGLALDEGLASPDDTVPVYYGERNVYWVKFNIPGNPGHGSRFIENTAAEKAQYLINKLLGFREAQKKLLEANSEFTLGDVTTVNLTMISGGVQMNVVPNEFTLGFDMRITPTTNLKEFEKTLNKWCKEVRIPLAS